MTIFNTLLRQHPGCKIRDVQLVRKPVGAEVPLGEVVTYQLCVELQRVRQRLPRDKQK